jgi:hypothetical protein
MRSKTALKGLCVAVALSGILIVACGKAHRQIVVIDGSKAEFVTYGPPPKVTPELWAPGRTLIFRSDSEVPGAPKPASGKAGKVYRVNDSLEMEEVAEFDPKIPDDTLAYRYGS